ncbi:aminoglycoside 6-adenylyltransferase [Proteus cibarius]|uniref:Aminoglycoside 6-adenylyltransferase n=2 Tax=Proteus terrae TaxID=1574161 RepID=A0A6G6S9S1_9GAMM|nr:MULTISPECIES: aminoglycoside 6-adenylyltransferase [Proteus]QHP75738.1 aminoglycoside adenylyltransferase [Proteus vulgaris]MBG2915477.1 aminoglycoside 6-adenylyltransferase [Proteus terrae subsp. cibarius]MBG3089632.1 aminoglycoside 6-adenylyltransferase [Proteus terrae subsp. cibarius]MBG6039698.1 aminoglycoside 6-adenylyltransferase [Proteus terrae subsp. cibarius]MCM2365489.1 aminoglycoside 6-adenylyltransferase [Proteus sp. FZP2095]
MEPTTRLIDRMLSFALLDPRIEAVVLTGSLGRNRKIDSYSDIDIELIGYGATELAKNQHWLSQFGDALVSLQLECEDPKSKFWPIYLHVLAQGRKIDIMMAEPERIFNMKTEGLSPVYQRGYQILLDKTSLCDGLPEIGTITPPTLSKEQACNNAQEFWFEATQVAIAILRHEFWSANYRIHDMREWLMELLEQVALHNAPTQDVWYQGKNLKEWLPKFYSLRSLESTLAMSTPYESAATLSIMMAFFLDASKRLNHPIDTAIKTQELVSDWLIDNEFLTENEYTQITSSIICHY